MTGCPAQEMADAGVDIRDFQAVTGHGSLEMVQNMRPARTEEGVETDSTDAGTKQRQTGKLRNFGGATKANKGKTKG